MVGEVQHQRLTFDSFPYKGWLIGGFVRTYTTTRVTSCVTTTSHAPCYYTLLCSTLLSTSLHSFIIVRQHVWINHWDFSTQPFVACQVKGTNIATKSDRNFVSFSKLLFCNTVRLVRASWPFDPVYGKWRRATEKILKTSDILDGTEELKIWIQPFVFYLRSF